MRNNKKKLREIPFPAPSNAFADGTFVACIKNASKLNLNKHISATTHLKGNIALIINTADHLESTCIETIYLHNYSFYKVTPWTQELN